MTDRLYAVRGAVSLDEDTREQVLQRTQELLRQLLDRNGIGPESIVNVIFTATGDIHSEFPAAAARLMGLDGVPLLCAQELEVTSSLHLPRCIRVLVQYYGDRRPDPVYLGEAARLLQPPDPV